MKKIMCALAALTLVLTLAACGGRTAEGESESSAPVAVSEPSGPDAALSAALTELLAKHANETWYQHIAQAQVYPGSGAARAEITLKEESAQYADAAAALAGLFRAEQMDAFFPGLCGAAEELGIDAAGVAELGRLFHQLMTQDDAQNYDQIEKLGLPVFQLLADITGEKTAKIKADINARIVDDAKVAEVLFQALDETYAQKSHEITQAEMTRIASTILTEFQQKAIGKILFRAPGGTVLKQVG